jgi:deoxyribonuclease-4
MRVRELLENERCVKGLKKFLPTSCFSINTIPRHRYPTKLLSILKTHYSQNYAMLGILTEELLKDRDELNIDKLQAHLLSHLDLLIHKDELKSLTTSDYLQRVKKTSDKIFDIIPSVIYDVELEKDELQGHPDIMSQDRKHIFEVKTSGNLTKSWDLFLLQTFIYAVLSPESEFVHIVLPLQEHIFSFSLQDWEHRPEFEDCLSSAMMSFNSPVSPLKEETENLVYELFSQHVIGTGVKKEKRLSSTLEKMQRGVPYQIFLSPPNSSSPMKTVDDGEIALCADLVERRGLKVYVHCPYALNLSTELDTKDNYGVRCIREQLTLASACGFLGCVIHTGKSVDRSTEVGIMNMKENIYACLDYATEKCPLLLETPAKQGTELLNTVDEIMEFLIEFNDDRIALCLDTCHVFSAGYQPIDYLNKVVERDEWKMKLKLIHFNDSAREINCCVDRHASIGSGFIPINNFLSIASMAQLLEIPLICE